MSRANERGNAITSAAQGGQRCEYCGIAQHEAAWSRFHIEHIVARQHGGGDDLENLTLACPHCNLHKGPNGTGIDPVTGQWVRLFNPRTDVWDEHFAVVGVEVVGLTDSGRVAVSLLKMNAPSAIDLRRKLIG